MSNDVNQNIMERARDLLDDCVGMSWVEKALTNAIDSNDLDELYRLVTMIEGERARDEFYNNSILSTKDIY